MDHEIWKQTLSCKQKLHRLAEPEFPAEKLTDYVIDLQLRNFFVSPLLSIPVVVAKLNKFFSYSFVQLQIQTCKNSPSFSI